VQLCLWIGVFGVLARANDREVGSRGAVRAHESGPRHPNTRPAELISAPHNPARSEYPVRIKWDRSETNGSKLEWAQVFQIWLHPNRVGLAPNVEREHFRRAQRRGGLRIVASQDGRDESLRVNQDARIYSGVFPPGQRVVHELAIGRTAWLHIVNGEILLGDSVFRTGDGIGLIAERAVAFTTQSAAEVLLIDLGAPIPPPGGNGSAS
jgi:Quercetinase C-terminal cupin domain